MIKKKKKRRFTQVFVGARIEGEKRCFVSTLWPCHRAKKKAKIQTGPLSRDELRKGTLTQNMGEAAAEV